MNRSTALMFVLLVGCSDDPGTSNADSQPAPDMGAASDGAPNNASPNNAAIDAAVPNNAADMDPGDDSGLPGPDLAMLPSGWQDRAPLPGPQQEVAVVELGGLIYVMGGFSETASQLATVVAYDPATDSWSPRADFPTRANHMNAVVHEGQIWVTGFYSMGFNPDPRTFVYDPDANAWTPGPDLPTERGRGASAIGVIDGLIYVAGGGAPSGVVAMTDVLDPESGIWSALPDALRSFDHAGFGVVDGRLIVAAGRNGAISSHFDDVQIFDPGSGQWTQGAPIPTSRGGVASAVHEGALYVFGGEGDPNSPGRVFPQVEVYDVAADSWTQLDPMPSPRHGFGGATLDGVIYLPAGAPTEFLDAVDTHQVFIP